MSEKDYEVAEAFTDRTPYTKLSNFATFYAFRWWHFNFKLNSATYFIQMRICCCVCHLHVRLLWICTLLSFCVNYDSQFDGNVHCAQCTFSFFFFSFICRFFFCSSEERNVGKNCISRMLSLLFTKICLYNLYSQHPLRECSATVISAHNEFQTNYIHTVAVCIKLCICMERERANECGLLQWLHVFKS